jgi:hypothetical protein
MKTVMSLFTVVLVLTIVTLFVLMVGLYLIASHRSIDGSFMVTKGTFWAAQNCKRVSTYSLRDIPPGTPRVTHTGQRRMT